IIVDESTTFEKDFTKNKGFETLLNHADETAELSNETQPLATGTEIEENLNKTENPAPNQDDFLSDIPTKGKRGRKKGSKNSSTSIDTQPKQEPIDCDILLNALIIDPIGGFF